MKTVWTEPFVRRVNLLSCMFDAETYIVSQSLGWFGCFFLFFFVDACRYGSSSYTVTEKARKQQQKFAENKTLASDLAMNSEHKLRHRRAYKTEHHLRFNNFTSHSNISFRKATENTTMTPIPEQVVEGEEDAKTPTRYLIIKTNKRLVASWEWL